jgi:hypothetical protein
MSKEKYPPGWNEARVRRVVDFYESQTDEEAAAEIDSVSKRTTMEVPTQLVPAVRRLIGRQKTAKVVQTVAERHSMRKSGPKTARPPRNPTR